jgi:translation initiation factor IF-2
VSVSGKTGQGIDTLEDAILTLSEILDHRAPKEGNVEGWVLESSTTEDLGRTATILVRRGTLRVGDVLVAGQSWAKVRTLRNEFGQTVEHAEPGAPVSVDGWRTTPNPGDEALQASDEQQAAAVVRTREDLEAQVKLAADMQAVNEHRQEHARIRDEETKGLRRKELKIRQRRLGLIEGSFVNKLSVSDRSNALAAANDGADKVVTLNFVIKADVIGSAEAVVNLISTLGTNLVRVQIVRTSTGALSKTDIDMAAAADATILAFNADVPTEMRHLANEENVEILEHDVIYRIPEVVKKKMQAALPKKVVQRVSGEAEILASFEIKVEVGGVKTKKLVAGCKVRNGMIKKGSKVRVMRDGKVVYDGMYFLYMMDPD